MSKTKKFPNFWETFAASIQRSAANRGFWAYVPWFLVCLTGAGLAVWWWIKTEYFLDVREADTIATLSAFVVVGGLLSAVSVACMAQIYVTVSDPMFGDYLKEEEVFDLFIFWPQFTLLIQVSFVIVISLGIVLTLTGEDDARRLLWVSEGVALLIYVTTKTWQLLEAMRMLAWHRQEYASLLLQAQQQRNPSSGPRIVK